MGITVGKVDETTEAMHTTTKEVFNNILKYVTSVVINECG